MRGDNLFDDLQSQLAQGLVAEEIDLRAEEEPLRKLNLEYGSTGKAIMTCNPSTNFAREERNDI